MSQEETNTMQALNSFFGKVVSKEEFAQYMRKFAHAAIMLNFKDDNYKEQVEDGYYFLTELVELLDPLLYKPE